MADALRINLDVSAFDAFMDGIKNKSANAVRPAAQAGAQVLYDETLTRVPVSLKGHWFHGSSFKKTGQKYYFDSGSLKGAIYQAYSKDNSAEGKRATYHVSWNAKKAPYGHMVEFGTSRAPAKPFLRPAFVAKESAVADAMKQTYIKHMNGAA